MDLNPIHHPSTAKKMKCFFLDYAQLLMIGWAEWWTQTPSTIPLQPKKWNAHFQITFNFWWLAGLVDGLKPHSPPFSSQKMKCTYFDYVQLLLIGRASWWTQTPSTTNLQAKKWNPDFCITFNFWCWPDWSMDSNPIHHPSPTNKMKCFFLDHVHFWWSARLVDGLKPHPPPLSSQRNEMLIFWLCSISDVGQTGQWTWTSSTTPLQPKNEMLIFGLCSTSDD